MTYEMHAIAIAKLNIICYTIYTLDIRMKFKTDILQRVLLIFTLSLHQRTTSTTRVYSAKKKRHINAEDDNFLVVTVPWIFLQRDSYLTIFVARVCEHQTDGIENNHTLLFFWCCRRLTALSAHRTSVSINNFTFYLLVTYCCCVGDKVITFGERKKSWVHFMIWPTFKNVAFRIYSQT